jgi:CBS domain-containing protein
MNVRQLMTEHPTTCRVGDSASDAARIMWDCDCGAVPVLDDQDRVAGIVTDRDICMAAYFQGRPLAQIEVSGIMSRDLCTCAADDDVTAAERTMRENQVRRLPVVENGGRSLVGILSLSDVVRGVKQERTNGRSGEEFIRTVEKISEPRMSTT